MTLGDLILDSGCEKKACLDPIVAPSLLIHTCLQRTEGSAMRTVCSFHPSISAAIFTYRSTEPFMSRLKTNHVTPTHEIVSGLVNEFLQMLGEGEAGPTKETHGSILLMIENTIYIHLYFIYTHIYILHLDQVQMNRLQSLLRHLLRLVNCCASHPCLLRNFAPTNMNIRSVGTSPSCFDSDL